MATALEVNNDVVAESAENEEETACSWEICPPEILLLIFEKMSTKTLSTCMFVNSKWKRIIEHVINVQNKWQDVVDTMLISKGEHLLLKSNEMMTMQQIYYNSVLWNNFDNADIKLKGVHEFHNIKKINVYRDSVIVVRYQTVLYFNVANFEMHRELDLRCRDFVENDYMIVKVQDYDRHILLQMFGKVNPHDFDICRACKMQSAEKVILYKIENNRCYVFNHRSCLVVYAVLKHRGWQEIFTATYYGNFFEVCNLNIYKDEAFLLISTGAIFKADPAMRSFKKVLHLNHFPMSEKFSTIYNKVFFGLGFVFGVGANEPKNIQRYTLKDSNVYIYKMPRLSCMTEHSHVLLLGYMNGMVEFYIPRDLSKTGPLRRFNIKDFAPDIEDVQVISLDVYEGVGYQRLFIATNTRIIHLKVTYPECDTYNNMWREYVNLGVISDFKV